MFRGIFGRVVKTYVNAETAVPDSLRCRCARSCCIETRTETFVRTG